MALTAENKGKEDIAMEENNRMNEQEDPQPSRMRNLPSFRRKKNEKATSSHSLSKPSWTFPGGNPSKTSEEYFGTYGPENRIIW